MKTWHGSMKKIERVCPNCGHHIVWGKMSAGIDVFHSRVVPEPNTGCWLWIGTMGGNGYGQVFDKGRRQMAHRVSYELAKGPIPPGLFLDHLCRVRSCVNPDHLEPVTHAENVRRGLGPVHQALKTHCPKGHPYDEQNTKRRNGQSNRTCRICQNEYARNYYAQAKASGVTSREWKRGFLNRLRGAQ